MIKLKALTVTSDQAGLSARKHKAAITLARDIAAAAALKDFEGVTRAWKHKPAFKITRDDDSTTVQTDDEIFFYQDQGTKKHVITPSKKKALAWPGGRHPVKRVNHPGTKARHFSTTVNARAQKFLAAETERQLAKAAAKG